jgi:hypothetical protein
MMKKTLAAILILTGVSLAHAFDGKTYDLMFIPDGDKYKLVNEGATIQHGNHHYSGTGFMLVQASVKSGLPTELKIGDTVSKDIIEKHKYPAETVQEDRYYGSAGRYCLNADHKAWFEEREKKRRDDPHSHSPRR